MKHKKSIESGITNHQKSTLVASMLFAFKLILVLIPFAFMLVFDVTYIYGFQIDKLSTVYNWLIYSLKMKGFSRTKALSLLESNLGVLVTMLSIVMTMGTDLKKRLENRVFGIPQKEMYRDYVQKGIAIIEKSVYIIPLLMILFMNLGFCASGYTILVYDYCIVIYQYFWRNRSHNIERSCEDIIHILLSYMGDNDYYISEENIMKYQSLLGDVRRGIDRQEGWRYAELLSVMFMNKITDFHYKKCYILSYYYFDGIFPENQRDDYEKFRLIKIWIKEMLNKESAETEDWNKNQLILWSILNQLFLSWNEKLVRVFLNWFSNFANRLVELREAGNDREIRIKIKKQAGIVLIFLESWFEININNVTDIQSERSIYLLWEYGSEIFREDIVFFQNECDWLYNLSVAGEGEIIKNSVQYLKEDYMNDWHRSHVRDFIAMNWED